MPLLHLEDEEAAQPFSFRFLDPFLSAERWATS